MKTVATIVIILLLLSAALHIGHQAYLEKRADDAWQEYREARAKIWPED